MKVSVIIPVFNAEKYLDTAVGSALIQPEVIEVLLVEDFSEDGSLAMCNRWQEKDSRVVVFRTGVEGNKGAAIARNIGLKHATQPFISFLDADDYYLNGRFREDQVLFFNHPSIVGVYNSTVLHTHQQKEIPFLNSHFRNGIVLSMPLSFQPLSQNDLFAGEGFHLNGLTIRRDLLPQPIFFDTQLRQGQDVDFAFRLGFLGSLYTSDQSHPKAVYTVHEQNTIFKVKETIYYRRKLYKKLFRQSFRSLTTVSLSVKFLRHFAEYHFLHMKGTDQPWKKWKKLGMLPTILYDLLFCSD